MKKIITAILLTLTYLAITLISPQKTLASCYSISNPIIHCSSSNPYTCTNSSVWCCESPNECNLFTGISYDEINKTIGLKTDLSGNLGSIIGALLPIILTIAGIILFIMLIAGGFTLLSGAASQESQEKGQKMITSSLIGFFIIFASYWIAQILQIIFKISIIN